MNKIFGLAIAVVVVIALLTVFKEQAVEISKKLFSNFSNSIDSNLILVLPKLF